MEGLEVGWCGRFNLGMCGHTALWHPLRGSPAISRLRVCTCGLLLILNRGTASLYRSDSCHIAAYFIGGVGDALQQPNHFVVT